MTDLDIELKQFLEEVIPTYDVKIYGIDERVILIHDYELIARHFAKWQKEQTIKKAREWLEEHFFYADTKKEKKEYIDWFCQEINN